MIDYKNDLTCPKCGHTEIIYRYIQPVTNRCEVVEREEKIRVKCERCEWTEFMKTKDQ